MKEWEEAASKGIIKTKTKEETFFKSNKLKGMFDGASAILESYS